MWLQHKKHYLYLLDKNDEAIFYFNDLGKEVGKRGLAQFLSTNFAIVRDAILGWEITKLEDKWGD